MSKLLFVTLMVCFLRGGGLVLSSHCAIKTGFTAQGRLVATLTVVDLVRGCATFGLNGLAGPCVRFSGDAWRDGVQIATPPGCFPMAAVVGRSLGGRCVISCATPPTPPSMRETASHPMTAAEHLAAGSLRTVPGALLDAFID